MPFTLHLPRAVVDEIMDYPDLDRGEHLRALTGLRRINRASNTAAAMWRVIQRWYKQIYAGAPQTIAMLDIACGGGDVPLEVAARARGHDVPVHLTLLDRSSTALERAGTAAALGDIRITAVEQDALAPLPAQQTYTLITNSLFLHHLGRDEVIRLLTHVQSALVPGGLLVISDLRRSRLGLLVAHLGCRVLTRSRIVRFDGPASVRAAWRPQELRQMAVEAGMVGAQIKRSWPWRMMLIWQRPDAR